MALAGLDIRPALVRYSIQLVSAPAQQNRVSLGSKVNLSLGEKHERVLKVATSLERWENVESFARARLVSSRIGSFRRCSFGLAPYRRAGGNGSLRAGTKRFWTVDLWCYQAIDDG